MHHETVHDHDHNHNSESVTDKPFIQVNMVNATELKPDAKYLLVIDQAVVSDTDLRQLMDSLGQMGIKNAVALHVPGDPDTAVKIIEQKPDKGGK